MLSNQLTENRDFGLYLPLDLQFFADGGEPEPKPDGDPTPPQDDAPTPEQKTFTQADLDKILADRLAREKKKYEDYDTLKTKLTEFEKRQKEQELASLNDKEKAEKLAAEEAERANTLQKQLEETLSNVKAQAIKAAFREAAMKQNIEHIDDAFKLIDLSTVEVSDTFEVNGIDTVVEQFAKERPYLLKSNAKVEGDVGGPTNPPPTKTDKSSEELLDAARKKAEKTGRVEDMVAYSQLKRKLGR